MFINCPHCQALIATDPATDLPPAKCPRCAAGLRETAVAVADAPPATGSQADTAMHTATTAGAGAAALAASPLPGIEPLDARPADEPGIATGQARADLPTAIAAAISPIATLLKPAAQAPAEAPAPDASTSGAAPEDRSTAAPAPGNEAVTALTPAGDAATTPQASATSTAVETAEPKIATDIATTAPALASPAGDAVLPTTTPQAPAEPTAAEAAEPETATDIADATAPAPESPTGDASARPATSAVEATPRTAEAARVLPSFARTGTLPRSGFDWKTATAATALALLLLLQLLLAGRAQLADDARWRPLVSTLCSAFGCALPPWREPAAFTVLARDVRPHPSLPGVLRVTATLRNDARWPQPWPRLRLTLSDVDGNPVAARDFAAREYLGARSPPPQIASGQVAAFAMDIVEPAPRSVAFDFELH